MTAWHTDCFGNPSMLNMNKYSPLLAAAISITALFALAACGTEVIGGGSGGTGANATTSTSSANGGNGGNGNGGSGVAGGNPGSSNAQSMLYSELQSPPNPSGTTVASSGSGGGPDGNTLYISVSNTPEICTDPFAAEDCGNHWRVSFGIPVALQKVGIIPLNDPSIISNSSFSGLADGTGQCPFGGGSFWDGELEITAIDAMHVQGILTNTSTFDFDANGVFDAPRCF
jgi:hypothetical protein